MKIIHLTDIHGNVEQLAKLSEQIRIADAVAISGDLTNFGRTDQARKVIELIRKSNDSIFAVSGNCDYPEIDEYLSGEGISVNGICRISGDYVFAGISGSLAAPCFTPNVHTEEDVGKLLDNITEESRKAARPVILITHQPPFGSVCGRTMSGLQTGSMAIAGFIRTQKPAFCLCGHIHEARGIDKITNTPVVNPGPVKEGRFALIDTDIGEIILH